MRVLIDMDDVIADTLEYTITCLGHMGIPVNRKDLSGRYLEDILNKEQIELMHSITSSPSFFKKIPLKTGCYDVLKRMQQAYDIRIVSNAFVFPNSMNDKYWWIKHKLDFIDDSQVVFCGKKSDIKGDVLIDDTPDNLLSYEGEKYIFSAPHNIMERRFCRVENWKDVENVFCN